MPLPTLINLKKLERKLNGRTLDEALKYLEICKTCSKYRNVLCFKDKGCDVEDVFLARLARGFCKEKWDKNAHNMISHRFFTTADLVTDSYRLIQKVPTDCDIVIGAARSGMFPATVLSTQLHLPLFSVSKDSVAHVGSGWRLDDAVSSIKKILFVEDTLYSGRSFTKAVAIIKSYFPEASLVSAAVYVHPKSIDKVDYYVEMLPGRHYLEWNFFNSIAISRCIFDLDGILCEDIAWDDDDDGEKYLKALENAVPKYLVRREPIPIIATARLEKYRAITEQWLSKHGVSFKRLMMGPWPDNKSRSVKGEIARFKAGIYSSYSYTLFVESDPLQAAEIVELTGKEVLCPRIKRVLIR